jgi:hydrogenase-4 component B
LVRVPMVALAGGCAVLGLLGPLVIRALAPAIGLVAGMPAADVRTAMASPGDVLLAVLGVSLVFVVLTAGLLIARRRLMAGRTVSRTVTWDCGYARPTSRMEYTASSFTQPLVSFFHAFLRTRTALVPPSDYFPASASLRTQTDDICREKAYGPVFRLVAWLLSQLRWLQHGRVQIYVLYIALTLLALLLWKLE